MSSLTNWRRHSYNARRYPVRYGRDPGLSRNGKIGLAVAVVAAGAGAFFLFERHAKAQAAAPTAPAPVVPATPAGTPATPAAPPVSTSADMGKVLTHDPPPAGDLIVFNAPNGSQIGMAEKNSLVSILSNDGTWAQITTHNSEGRYADQTGFVHSKFLGAPDAQSVGSAATQIAQGVAQNLATTFSSLGF